MGKPWFAAKRFGYGAGPPITWQGSLATALYVAFFTVALVGLRGAGRILAAGGSTVAFIVLASLKTAGGWRWRWGDRDQPRDG